MRFRTIRPPFRRIRPPFRRSVKNGRITLELMAELNRNAWPNNSGITGRITLELLAELYRNTHVIDEDEECTPRSPFFEPVMIAAVELHQCSDMHFSGASFAMFAMLASPSYRRHQSRSSHHRRSVSCSMTYPSLTSNRSAKYVGQ